MHSNILQGRGFWTPSVSRKGSWLWRKTCKMRDTARRFLRASIGDGRTALFWHDSWCGSGPLLPLIGPLGPLVTGISLGATVSEAIRNGCWQLPLGRHPLVRMLRGILPQPPALSSSRDVYHWITDDLSSTTLNTATQKRFQSSLTWSALYPPTTPVLWHKSIWFAGHLPKHAFTTWVIAWNRLPTRNRLLSWGCTVDPNCLLCNDPMESRDHLFFKCRFSSTIWSSFLSKAHLQSPVEIMDILTWASSTNIPKKLRTILKLLLQATMYEVWIERNQRLHRSESRHVEVIIKSINTTMANRLNYLSCSSKSISATAQESILKTWLRVFQVTNQITN